jgi:hypothetical protein
MDGALLGGRFLQGRRRHPNRHTYRLLRINSQNTKHGDGNGLYQGEITEFEPTQRKPPERRPFPCRQGRRCVLLAEEGAARGSLQKLTQGAANCSKTSQGVSRLMPTSPIERVRSNRDKEPEADALIQKYGIRQ